VTGRTTSATATQSIRPAENVPAAPPKTESGLRTAGVADPVADLSAEVHAPPRVAPASGPAELGPVVSTLDKGMAFSRALLGLAEIAGTILSGIAAISDFEQHDYVGGGLNTAAATGVVAPTVGEVAAPLAIAWENTKNVAELAGWEGQCRVMAADFETGQISNYEFEQLARSCPEIMIGREEWQRVMRAWINDEWPGDY
jgi:hypothetical protein